MQEKDKASWIGKSTRRVGGVERVTGTLRYAADLRLDNTLYVKLVQVNCARARILSIDTEEAKKVDGVVSIMTAADLPQPMPRCGPGTNDRPLLAVDETKFFGEPVAAVAAETLDAAEAAAALVGVEYEELPAVLTVEAARDPQSPLVQDPSIRAGKPLAGTNIFEENHFGWGDIDGAHADCVIANEYRFPMITHFAIEPHAYLAAPDQNGVIIWSPIQHPYVLQRVVAYALQWPISRVRVIAPDPGGGFGGKGYPKFEPLLAFLALQTGRPVRLVLTLEETFQAVRRASARVRIRTGFDSSGHIQFQDIDADFLIGAYADVGPRVVSKAGFSACGPYRVPHARTIARALLSHTTPSTAFRGFGTPQLSWAVESQFDEAARRLGLDRVEIRRRNIPQKGESFIPGDTPADGLWVQTLEKAAAAIGWGKPLPKQRGRGISMGMKSSSTASVSFAMVRLHHDGSASILAGTSDMGQGARTVFTQLVAQELGIPLERITVVLGDTAVVPYDMSTSASRSTVFMGNSILKACQDAKSQLGQLAAELFDIPKDEVTVEPGSVQAAGQTLTYAELFRKYYGPARGEVLAIGSTRSQFLPNHPLMGKAAFWEVMCAAVEVEVDPETGMVQLTRLALASDVGKALNPQQVEAQDEGSVIMGLGHTLMEHLILDEHGRILNLGALDYRIPTIKDIPLEFHSILIENADGPGPFGAKGTGEGGILSIAAAVGSAVAEATGVVIRELPLTPERVWRSIQEVSIEPESEPQAAESAKLS